MWIWIAALLIVHAQPKKNPWETITSPVKADQSIIYGSYSSGCIVNAEELPLAGPGFEVVNPYRHRYYAHTSLIQLISHLGKWAQNTGAGKVVIGDLGQPAGGPLTGAHMSHQIGLDADIRLHLLLPDKAITNRNSFNSTDVTQCRHSGKKINYTFLAEKWPLSSHQLLQTAALDERVERIFVSAGIKKHLCEAFADHPQWLKKIRPEWGHTSHFHLRLRCPEGMTSCLAQNPIPEDSTDLSGVGCSGNDFNSWFIASKNTHVSSACIPRSTKAEKNTLGSELPRWENVMNKDTFPKECKELLAAFAAKTKDPVFAEKKKSSETQLSQQKSTDTVIR